MQGIQKNINNIEDDSPVKKRKDGEKAKKKKKERSGSKERKASWCNQATTNNCSCWRAKTAYQCECVLSLWSKYLGRHPTVQLDWENPSAGDEYEMHGHRRLQIKGDGNCFYGAIAKMTYNEDARANEVRKDVRAYLITTFMKNPPFVDTISFSIRRIEDEEIKVPRDFLRTRPQSKELR